MDRLIPGDTAKKIEGISSRLESSPRTGVRGVTKLLCQAIDNLLLRYHGRPRVREVPVASFAMQRGCSLGDPPFESAVGAGKRMILAIVRHVCPICRELQIGVSIEEIFLGFSPKTSISPAPGIPL